MKCCAGCFGDRGLRKEISYRSSITGRCEYCHKDGETLIDAAELLDKFSVVVNAYQRDPIGRSLVEWFKSDWVLFPDLDDANAQRLLGDILDDGQVVREKFVPSPQYESDSLGRWEELRKELMHQNRYFPQTQVDFDRLETLLASLLMDMDDVPKTWYRARIQTGEDPFQIAEMKAPPPKYASHGRANPAGIPYLYLGSEIRTAASEIRPHKGEIVCVATFTAPSDLKIVDLRNPRYTVSPFLLTDEADIGRMRSDITFLERLGIELTRPVLPQAAAFDYAPSQYLCEFIKKCGYDGVIYRSSVGAGMNLALFKPERATIGATVDQHEVTRVDVDVGVLSAATG
ncbi:MAG: RES family NAD+ phosphorylase [Alphaproteobacteria bacterium]|nr:RES family NAD+ phosphorylase [Alphaproteobacteria bacterium]